MELKTGIGNSTLTEAYDAAAAAAKEALTQLADEKPDFAFVFSTIGYEHEDVLDGVKSVLKDIPISGSTYEGIIGRQIVNESLYAVQVTCFKSEGVKFINFSVPNVPENSGVAGEQLGQMVADVKEEGNRVLFLFPDFKGNMTSFFEGIEKKSPIPLIGGLSSDNMKFHSCFQFHNGEVNSNSVSATLMVGDFEMKTVVTHGSEPIGKEGTVSKSKDNVIMEIDGKPALDVASESFGQSITPENQVSALLCLGIGIKVDNAEAFLSPYVLRAFLGIDFEAKALILPTVVQEGTHIQLMRRDPQGVIDSGKKGAENIRMAVEAIPAKPQLVAQFDCAGRGKAMIGEEVGKGMELVQEGFESSVPWMGAFAFGEISPINEKNFFHNYTGTMAVFF